jgi:hypothetical protein
MYPRFVDRDRYDYVTGANAASEGAEMSISEYIHD